MKRIIAAAIFSAIATTATAQLKETPLVKINGKVISAEEFDYIYNKNNTAALLPISKKEYLGLFINYKLKAEEGRAMGIDTTKQYKNESSYYYEELAKPYQTDTIAQKAAEDLIKARLNEEIDASHILIRVAKNASPDDTLAAYKKAERIRQSIIDGADFGETAKKESDDPSARQNSGRLGYFSALKMVEEFEDAAFNTSVGQLSPVFRTQFGYHFMKVHDRRPFPGKVLTRHIMKIFPRGYGQEQEDALKLSIDSVYQKLQQGGNFEELAMTFSDDKQTAVKGGEMPWITESMLNPNFAEYGRQAFALKNAGDYSGVFKTAYGWHIVKLVERRDRLTDEELEQQVHNAMHHGHPAAHAGLKSYENKMMKEYALKWNDDVKKQVADILGSQDADSLKNVKLSAISTPLATYGSNEKIMADNEKVALYWKTEASADDAFDTAAKVILSDYDKNRLAEKYPDFKYTMQEYFDGLLVFEVNKKVIWNTDNIDSLELNKIYEENISRYTTGSKFDGKIYFCKDEKTAQKVKSLAAKKPAKAEKLADKVVSGQQEKGGQYDEILWPNIPSEFAVVCGTYSNGERRPFDEVKSQIISDYQQRLEMEYIKKLSAKYKPVIVGKLK